MRAFLALGSNLGDRLAFLQRALDGLRSVPGVVVTGVSHVYETEAVGPEQPDYLNAVVALRTELDARGLLGVARRLEQDAERVRAERWGPRTLDVDVLWVEGETVDEPDLVVPHPRMHERGFVLAPLADVAPDLVTPRAEGWPGVRDTGRSLSLGALGDRGADRERAPGRLSLVGPGRAGSTVALALAAVGWEVVGVTGRAPDAPSTVTAAACLDAPPRLLDAAGRGADLVVVATPDAAIERTAAGLAPSVEPGALVIHLAGALGVEALAPLAEARADVRTGALHPLQSLPSASVGLERLPGTWAAVDGDPAVAGIATSIGLHAFHLPGERRAGYHAAAVVASNHLVALLGQVERLADACGVPFAAFAPLARSSLEGAFEIGPRGALTGPVARGDLRTVEVHLRALGPAERDAYRALAREAARLAGPRASGIDRLLDDLTRTRRREEPPRDPPDERGDRAG